MKSTIRFLISLFLYGCATIGTVKPMSSGQERAVDIIWHSVYMQDDPVPRIRWISGKQLNCNNGRGFSTIELDENDYPISVCVEGFTFSTREVLVSWHGEDSYSQTAIAHELWHIVNLRYGIVDRHHLGEGWKSLDDCKGTISSLCGIVDRANRTVAGNGL